MNLAKIVVHEVQRNLVRVILKLFAESVCEPRKAAHPHSHRKVLPLYVTGGDVLRIRTPAQNSSAASDTGSSLLPERKPNARADKAMVLKALNKTA